MWFKFILFYCIVQYILELINNLRRQFKTNKYLICICISEVDYSRILLNLISNFFQIYMDEYEKENRRTRRKTLEAQESPTPTTL